MKNMLLCLLCLVLTSVVFSQNYNKGFNALDKGDIEKAEHIFYNVLNASPNDVIANFSMALTLAHRQNISCDLFEAFERIEIVQTNFASIHQNDKQKYADKINLPKIEQTKLVIDSALFVFVTKQNNDSLIDRFLAECPNSIFYKDAKLLKENLAFERVTIQNTPHAYNQFILHYPNSIHIAKVQQQKFDLYLKQIKSSPSIVGYDSLCQIFKHTNMQHIAQKELQQYIKSIVPILVVSGYGSNLENITLSELKDNYINNKIHVLASIKPLLDSLWNADNRFVIDSLSHFLPLAKYNMLITDIHNLTSQFKTLSLDSIHFFETPEKYPLILNADSLYNYSNFLTKVTITGVSAITRGTGRTADRYGTDYLTKDIQHEFQTSDYVHVSHEVSFAEGCVYDSPKDLKFCAKERDFQALLDIKTNIVELTGNHNLDYKFQAYKNTIDWYNSHNIKSFGGGTDSITAAKPIILTLKGGQKLAFVGYNEICCCYECIGDKYHYGANRYDSTKAVALINKLKTIDSVNFIIVTVHMEEIDGYKPLQRHIEVAHQLIDMGYDMVYASQAHWVKPVEFYNGKPIYYGAGNFLFDQTHKEGLRQGFFFHNYFYNGKLVYTKPIFTYISDTRRPELATPEQVQKIKEAIFWDNYLYKADL